MSRDGLFPKMFCAVHKTFKTPHISTWIAGFVVGIPAGIFAISDAADLSNIGTLFAFVLVSLGVIILRDAAGPAARVQGSVRAVVSFDLDFVVRWPHDWTDGHHVGALHHMAGDWSVHLPRVQPPPERVRQRGRKIIRLQKVEVRLRKQTLLSAQCFTSAMTCYLYPL